MPITDTHPDALAEIYARSIYELAEAKGGRPLIESTLGELEEIMEMARADERFAEFLASRVLPVTERSKSLERIFAGRTGDLTLRFLQVLNDKARLGHLGKIVGALDALVQEKFGRVEVDVYTAAPISREELETVRRQLQSTLGKEPVLHAYTDPSMIGGLRLQIGDRLIDGSVATRLRQVREQLGTQGASALRARIDGIIGE